MVNPEIRARNVTPGCTTLTPLSLHRYLLNIISNLYKQLLLEPIWSKCPLGARKVPLVTRIEMCFCRFPNATDVFVWSCGLHPIMNYLNLKKLIPKGDLANKIGSL